MVLSTDGATPLSNVMYGRLYTLFDPSQDLVGHDHLSHTRIRFQSLSYYTFSRTVQLTLYLTVTVVGSFAPSYFTHFSTALAPRSDHCSPQRMHQPTWLVWLFVVVKMWPFADHAEWVPVRCCQTGNAHGRQPPWELFFFTSLLLVSFWAMERSAPPFLLTFPSPGQIRDKPIKSAKWKGGTISMGRPTPRYHVICVYEKGSTLFIVPCMPLKLN